MRNGYCWSFLRHNSFVIVNRRRRLPYNVKTIPMMNKFVELLTVIEDYRIIVWDVSEVWQWLLIKTLRCLDPLPSVVGMPRGKWRGRRRQPYKFSGVVDRRSRLPCNSLQRAIPQINCWWFRFDVWWCALPNLICKSMPTAAQSDLEVGGPEHHDASRR